MPLLLTLVYSTQAECKLHASEHEIHKTPVREIDTMGCPVCLESWQSCFPAKVFLGIGLPQPSPLPIHLLE